MKKVLTTLLTVSCVGYLCASVLILKMERDDLRENLLNFQHLAERSMRVEQQLQKGITAEESASAGAHIK